MSKLSLKMSGLKNRLIKSSHVLFLSLISSQAFSTEIIDRVSVSTNGSSGYCAASTVHGVQCWGDIRTRDSGTQDVPTPISIGGIGAGASSSVLGFNHSCAVVAGKVKCWGANNYGETGAPLSVYNPPFFQPQDFNNAVQVPNIPSGATRVVVGGGGKFYFLKNIYPYDGPIRGEQYLVKDLTPLSPNLLNRNFSCAIVSGAVYCWGFRYLGETLSVLESFLNNVHLNMPVKVVGLESGVTAIAAAGNAICAVVNGAVKCWGQSIFNAYPSENFIRVPTLVPGLESGVTDIAMRGRVACALVNHGVKCFGINESLGINTHTAVSISSEFDRNVSRVAISYKRICAIVLGAAKCFGYGDLGDGIDHGAVKTVATVSGAGSGVTSIAVSFDAACIVVNSQVRCWGDNSRGGLGTGTFTPSRTATPIPVKNLFTSASLLTNTQ